MPALYQHSGECQPFFREDSAISGWVARARVSAPARPLENMRNLSAPSQMSRENQNGDAGSSYPYSAPGSGLDPKAVIGVPVPRRNSSSVAVSIPASFVPTFSLQLFETLRLLESCRAVSRPALPSPLRFCESVFATSRAVSRRAPSNSPLPCQARENS